MQNALVEMRGHKDAITALAFSGDGEFLASGSLDTTVQLWRSDTGDHMKTFRPQQYRWGITALAFAPGAGKVAFVSQGAQSRNDSFTPTMLWDALSGRTSEIGGPPLRFSSRFAALGSCGADGGHMALAGTKLWIVNPGTAAPIDLPIDVWATSVALSETSLMMVGHEDGGLSTWCLKTSTRLSWVKAYKERVNQIAWSLSTGFIAIGDGQSACLFDDSGKPLQQVDVGGPVRSLVAIPDRRTFICSMRDKAGLAAWGGDRLQEQSIKQVDGWPWAVAVSSDGQRMAVGDASGCVRIFRVEDLLQP